MGRLTSWITAKIPGRGPRGACIAGQDDGCIEFMDTRAIGLSYCHLGGGRKHADDIIDHRVGLSGFCLVGDNVNKGDPLVTIHAADETAWQAAAEQLPDAIVVGRRRMPCPPFMNNFMSRSITVKSELKKEQVMTGTPHIEASKGDLRKQC